MLAGRGSDGLMGANYSEEGVDILQRRYLDVDAMIAKGEAVAEEYVDLFSPILDEHPDMKPIEHFRERHEEGEIERDEVGDLFWDQKGVKAAKEAYKEHRGLDRPPFGWGGEPVFRLKRHGPARFVELMGKDQLAPPAIVHDGEWLNREEMGWFGVSYDQHKTWEEWVEEASKLIYNLDDETVIANVDCHI